MKKLLPRQELILLFFSNDSVFRRPPEDRCDGTKQYNERSVKDKKVCHDDILLSVIVFFFASDIVFVE